MTALWIKEARRTVDKAADSRLRSKDPGTAAVFPVRVPGPEIQSRQGAFGVYVHVPFCRLRCDYCAFATYTDRDHLIDAYVAACRDEVHRAIEEGMGPATSVFVGGGTPSRLPADLLAALLESVPTTPGAEVTVECNPEDVDDNRLEIGRASCRERV